MGENIFFLDTNVLLDYLEERNKDVKELLKVMIEFGKEGSLVLATSVFNIAELLDNELNITYYFHCKNNIKMSDNEIKTKKGDRRFYKDIATINRKSIEEKLYKFIEESGLNVYRESSDPEMSELYDLIYDNCLQSQDAIIVSTAIYNESDYLITNDQHLIDSLGTKIYTYNLSLKEQREKFRRELKSLGYSL